MTGKYLDSQYIPFQGGEIRIWHVYWPYHVKTDTNMGVVFGCDFQNAQTEQLYFRMIVGNSPNPTNDYKFDRSAVWFQGYDEAGYLTNEPPKGFPSFNDYSNNFRLALKILSNKPIHKYLNLAIKDLTAAFDKTDEYVKQHSSIQRIMDKNDMLNNLVFFYQLCSRVGANVSQLKRFKYCLKSLYNAFKSKMNIYEASKTSYYNAYMMAHPEDQLPRLIESLIKEFAADLKKNKLNLESFIVDRQLDYDKLYSALDKLKFRYHWEKISAQTYAAIITRATATSINANGQKYNENEISFDDVRRGVSRRVLEKCLDIICHNTNVIEANGIIRNHCIKTYAQHSDVNVDVISLFRKYNVITGPDIVWGDLAYQAYAAWASFGKGKFERYVCDSDNAPKMLKKVLNSCPYDGG